MPKNFACTRAVNPAGVAPRITLDQLWKGLEKKVINPEAFLPMATGAEFIINENGQRIRKMNTKHGDVVQEVIQSYEGTMVYFDVVDSDLRVTNLISYDQNNELLLTFSFVGGIPGRAGLGESSSPEELNKTIGGIIEKTLDVLREEVKNGALL